MNLPALHFAARAVLMLYPAQSIISITLPQQRGMT